MTNVFDDEKKKNKKEEETKQDAVEKQAVKDEKQKEATLAELKAQAKAELQAEGVEATKKSINERTLLIKKIQSKKSKSSEEKEILKREMVARASENAKLPRNLGNLLPSQFTLKEMLSYCKDNNIPFSKGDNTILLRARIKAFRNPGRAERLRMLEDKPLMGKIIR